MVCCTFEVLVATDTVRIIVWSFCRNILNRCGESSTFPRWIDERFDGRGSISVYSVTCIVISTVSTVPHTIKIVGQCCIDVRGSSAGEALHCREQTRGVCFALVIMAFCGTTDSCFSLSIFSQETHGRNFPTFRCREHFCVNTDVYPSSVSIDANGEMKRIGTHRVAKSFHCVLQDWWRNRIVKFSMVDCLDQKPARKF